MFSSISVILHCSWSSRPISLMIPSLLRLHPAHLMNWGPHIFSSHSRQEFSPPPSLLFGSDRYLYFKQVYLQFDVVHLIFSFQQVYIVEEVTESSKCESLFISRKKTIPGTLDYHPNDIWYAARRTPTKMLMHKIHIYKLELTEHPEVNPIVCKHFSMLWSPNKRPLRAHLVASLVKVSLVLIINSISSSVEHFPHSPQCAISEDDEWVNEASYVLFSIVTKSVEHGVGNANGSCVLLLFVLFVLEDVFVEITERTHTRLVW